MFPTKVVENNETEVLSTTPFLSVRSTISDMSEQRVLSTVPDSIVDYTTDKSKSKVKLK
jgi:hypothetical protein